MIISVRFKGTSTKVYDYNTNIDNLIIGGWYNIIADNRTSYDNPVQILNYKQGNNKSLRTLTQATLIKAPSKPHPYKNIYINKKKGVVTVIWEDGTHTKVKCQDGDNFDSEKGIALCFMKKYFNNRGCYNDVFRNITEIGE